MCLGASWVQHASSMAYVSGNPCGHMPCELIAWPRGIDALPVRFMAQMSVLFLKRHPLIARTHNFAFVYNAESSVGSNGLYIDCQINAFVLSANGRRKGFCSHYCSMFRRDWKYVWRGMLYFSLALVQRLSTNSLFNLSGGHYIF